MIGRGAIYDYDAIRRAWGRDGARELDHLEVRHFNGPNWNPCHLRPQAARLYQYVRQPIAWCENPTRFGWGEPGPTWWCTTILANREHWDFPVVDGCSLGPVKLPSTWCLSHHHDGHKSPKNFASFDDALMAIAEGMR